MESGTVPSGREAPGLGRAGVQGHSPLPAGPACVPRSSSGHFGCGSTQLSAYIPFLGWDRQEDRVTHRTRPGTVALGLAFDPGAGTERACTPVVSVGSASSRARAGEPSFSVGGPARLRLVPGPEL